jgi:hypothetical protein
MAGRGKPFTLTPESAMTPTNLAPLRPNGARVPPRGDGSKPSPRLHVHATRRPLPKRRRTVAAKVALVFGLLLVGLNLFGMRYYLMPRGEQVRDPLHVWLRPSGYLGQSAGVLALLIFLFLWLYPLRKKFRWLAFTGAISKWLDVHSLAALGLPLLVAAHATWQFGGVIGLGFWSMMVVWLSGIVGRYIYARIPRSQAGVELTIEEIASQRQSLLDEIASWSGLDRTEIEAMLATDPTPTAGLGPLATLRRMIADDIGRRRAARRLRAAIRKRRPMKRREDAATLKEVLRLANREMALVQQSRMLGATQNVLRFWHVAHRPLAVTALVAVIIHVAVVVSLGATWFW